MVSGRDCNGEGRTEEKTTENQTCASGGSKGGTPGECPLPTDQNVLNFMQFFFGKFGKIVCCSPLQGRVGAPSCCEETANWKRRWVETSIVVYEDPMAALSIAMTLIYFRSR